MVTVHGGKSEYLVTEEKKARTLFWLSFFFVFVSSFVYLPLSFIYRGNHFISLLILIVFWGSGYYCLYLQRKKTKRVIDFFRGIKSECVIFYELLKLPKNYHLLWSLKINEYGNIDFVVVGPAGIFAIEVKSKKVAIDNKGKELTGSEELLEKFLRQTKRGAVNINKVLKEKKIIIFVEPILVFVNKYSMIRLGLKKKKEVFVVGKSFLRKVIKKNDHKNNLSKKEVEEVVNTLRGYQESKIKVDS